MAWNYSSAGSLSQSQTRKAAPKNLAKAAFSEGPLYVFERNGKWHTWDEERGFWLPPVWSEKMAREDVAERLALKARFAERMAAK